MPSFEDYLGEHGEYDPQAFDFAAFVEGLKSAHDADKGVWDAQIASKADTLTAKEAELTKAKLHNYDLLMRIPGSSTSDGNSGGGSGGNDPDIDPDHKADIQVNDLFNRGDK